jgi:vancomycin resistance protein YoaR
MNKKLVIVLLIVFAVIAGGIYGGYVYLDSRINIEGYYSGISVAGVDISGLSKNEALKKLEYSLEKDFGTKGVHVKSPEYKGEETFLSYSKLSYTYDYETALNEAYSVGRNGSIIDRFMTINELEATPVDIAVEPLYNESRLDYEVNAIADKYARLPKDAEFDFNGGNIKVTQHLNGTEVDVAVLKSDIVSMIHTGGTVNVPLRIVEPVIKAEFYEKINGKIGEFSTSFKGSAAGRVNNIKLSANAFKGVLLMPGDELSYNETTGPRMASAGYQEAPVILNGELTPGMGGGVCQTSTTLYNALLLADLEIIERSPHSMPPAYVPKGTDGAVATGYLDLVFKNNFDYPVYFDSEVDGTRVYFYIYGDMRSRDYSVKIDTQLNATIPYKIHENLDPTLPPGARVLIQEGRTGYKVSTFKSIIKNGEVVSTERISSDYYRERDFIYKIGPAVVVQPEVIAPVVEVPEPVLEEPSDISPEVLP